MPTRIMGTSASLWPTTVLSTEAQLHRLGVRTLMRSGDSPPLLLIK